MGIDNYSVTPADNDDAPPNGAPEGMLANAVNNVQRQVMADTKAGTPYTVANVVAVKALDSTKQATGNQISVVGLVTAGTGSGLFRYDSTSVAVGDDVDVIEPTDSIGRWLRNGQSLDKGDSAIFAGLTINGLTVHDGDITYINDNPELRGQDVDGVLFITPDTANNLGGNIKLFGSAHATQADDVEIRGSAVLQAHYDDSASLWDWQANDLLTSGKITGSAPSGFSAYAATQNNVTGQNELYTITFGTERFDIAADFNAATGVYTAPIAGKPEAAFSIRVTGFVAATSIEVLLVTSNFTWELVNTAEVDGSEAIYSFARATDVDASDTVQIQIRVNGEAGTIIDIAGTAGRSGFSLMLNSI